MQAIAPIQTALDALRTRGATLLADPSIERGGCFVESDIATVDARIAQRWRQAAGMLGQRADWSDEPGEIREDR